MLTLLYLRGGFAENERAVGVAVRGDVAAVFAERVDEAAGVFGDRSAVEDAVTMHEVGHLLGLVDLVRRHRASRPGAPRATARTEGRSCTTPSSRRCSAASSPADRPGTSTRTTSTTSPAIRNG